MAFVLDDVLGAVVAAKGVVQGIGAVVDALKGGVFGGNAKEKREELAARVEELRTALANVTKLGRIGDAYVRSHEDVLGLLALVRRAEQFLNDASDALEVKSRDGYQVSWRILDTVFDGMNTDLVRRVRNDRQEFFDREDQVKIEGWIDQFSEANTKAAIHLQTRSSVELRHDVDDMKANLENVESLLRSTVHDRILRAFQDVGS
jgi:hypothetical protein